MLLAQIVLSKEESNQITDNSKIKRLISMSTLAEIQVNVQPLADRVLVEPAPAEEKTAFGIIIPDTAKEKPQRGTSSCSRPR